MRRFLTLAFRTPVDDITLGRYVAYVIQKIDGRTPSSVRHAMRILGSYQAGETLELQIMRDKKRRKLEVEIPDDRTSQLMPGFPPAVAPAAAPVLTPAPEPAAPLEKT